MNIVLTSFWCNIPILEYMSKEYYEHQNVIILMSLVTDVINVSKISYWCLYSTVIMNIVLTSFWCNIPILEHVSTLWTSKCDHFDVTHNCDCQRHLSITMMSLSNCDYKHHFVIILMLHTKTRLHKCIKNIKMWSFRRHFTYRH